MNITRVERDGVEFFTIDETGESGMSESGIARLCGVVPSSVHRFITNNSLRWDHEKTLDPKFGKPISFCATSERTSSSSPGRLCGVTASSVHRFVSNSAVRWDHEKMLDPRFHKTINLCATNRENSSLSRKLNLKVLSKPHG